jgi:hypothetical protein
VPDEATENTLENLVSSEIAPQEHSSKSTRIRLQEFLLHQTQTAKFNNDKYRFADLLVRLLTVPKIPRTSTKRKKTLAKEANAKNDRLNVFGGKAKS